MSGEAEPTYEKMCGWNVILKVNGVTIDTAARAHMRKSADEITLTIPAVLKLDAGDVIEVFVSSDEKEYQIGAGGATMNVDLLRWY